MQSRVVEKIYIDTNVWFSYFLKGRFENSDSIEYSQSSSLIEKINSQQNLIALTSHLVILELTSTIRKKVASRTRYMNQYEQAEKIEQIHKDIGALTRTFIDHMTRWEKSKKLIIIKMEESLTEVLRREQTMLKNKFGRIKSSKYCGVCRSLNKNFYHQGIDHYDIQHAIIAEYAKANKLVTFDQSFNDIKEDFPTLDIQIFETRKKRI